MDNAQLSFEQILNATVRMLRTTWKAKVCLFLQVDDHGDLRIRAADGLPLAKVSEMAIKPVDGVFAQCFHENKIVETSDISSLGTLTTPTYGTCRTASPFPRLTLLPTRTAARFNW